MWFGYSLRRAMAKFAESEARLVSNCFQTLDQLPASIPIRIDLWPKLILICQNCSFRKTKMWINYWIFAPHQCIRYTNNYTIIPYNALFWIGVMIATETEWKRNKEKSWLCAGLITIMCVCADALCHTKCDRQSKNGMTIFMCIKCEKTTFSCKSFRKICFQKNLILENVCANLKNV